MPLRVVLDSTILVSAFLTPGGAADAVLQLGIEEAFSCCLADDIIAETVQRLLTPRLQQRYAYTADEVDTFKATLRGAFLIISDLPPLTGIVRDPNDDMILACAVAASASHVVTRDDDLLSLGTYEGVTIVTPEAFLTLLRTPE
jgi:putative PIN family toxin of toxin-antitoxin system